jgi:hypothetical protein
MPLTFETEPLSGRLHKRWEDSVPGDILCGKCGAPLAALYREDGIINLWGMRRDGNGIWRPTKKALVYYQKTGYLSEERTEGREHGLDRHPKIAVALMQRQVRLDRNAPVAPLAECPRCHKVQPVLGAKDLASLQT